MLIYIHLFVPGLAPKRPLSFDVNPNERVSAIHMFVERQIEGLSVTRSLFAGKILDVNTAISQYEIHKECTIQTMGKLQKVAAPNANGNGGAQAPENDVDESMDALTLSRQVTDTPVRYGDVLIINVMEARDLIKCDYWSGKSDPYCIVSVGTQSYRTRVISRNLNPCWNETFGFHIKSPEVGLEQKLVVLLWDHDYLTTDDFLGSVEIDLNTIPRCWNATRSNPSNYEKWYKLEEVASGEVRLLIRRASLSSPELQEILLRLVSKNRAWTNSMLKKRNVTLKHFLGEEPWVVNAPSSFIGSNTSPIAPSLHLNPALTRLENLLRQHTLKITNERTTARVANILWSQGALYTQDLPSRYLWLCDVSIPPIHLYHLLQEVSEGTLKGLSVAHNEPSSTFRHGRPSMSLSTQTAAQIAARVASVVVNDKADEDDEKSEDDDDNNNNDAHADADDEAYNSSCRLSAIATFKSCESAVLTLLRLQNRVVSLVDVDDPEREDFVAVVPTQPTSVAPGVARTVNISLYDEDNVDINPLHCGFASQPTQNGVHAFTDSVHVGILSVAGPYATTKSYEARGSQSHSTNDWGRHLLVLHRSGVLRAYTRISDFSQDARIFEIDIRSSDTLVLTCGPYSVEIVNTSSNLSYYIRAHNVVVLAQWKNAFRLCKVDMPWKSTDAEDANAAAAMLLCQDCNIRKPLRSFYCLDKRNPLTEPAQCISCLRLQLEPFKDAAVAQDKIGVVERLLEKFSVQDVKDLGTMEEFSVLLDACTKQFFKTQTELRVIHCPKCSLPFEMAYHTWATKQPNLTKDMGLDRQPLTPQAQSHFLSNRFRCPNEECQANFCRLCQVQPYHLGFTCDEYVVYLNSPQCRFCAITVVPDRNSWPETPQSWVAAGAPVCTGEECVEKAGKTCKSVLRCGHVCCGVHGELVCVPCLDGECARKRVEEEQSGGMTCVVKSDGNDLCGICYVEPLAMAPCMLLDCGHVFHAHCLEHRLQSRWNGLRINFKYAHCPFCNTWMKGTSVDGLMDAAKILYNRVANKIEQRLEIDEEEDEDYIVRVTRDELSPYYGKPLEWALHSYAFYECSRCRVPYYGGRRNCEDNVEEDQTNPDELVCIECSQSVGAKNCGIAAHADFLEWKCRFCCTAAVWFCFGTTHFCEYCHSHWPPNRHPANEKCPPPGQDRCPLGLPVGSHTNGDDQENEFCLGCAMCRQEERKKINKKALDEEREFARKRYERRVRLGLPVDDLQVDDLQVQGIGRVSNTLRVNREYNELTRESDAEHTDGCLSTLPIEELAGTDHIRYFEVVVHNGEGVTVGWALNNHALHVSPGMDNMSFGLSSDGNFVHSENQRLKVNESWGARPGITIGCGFDDNGRAFFTENGKKLVWSYDIGKRSYHACVNMSVKGARVQVNFGPVFKYDVIGYQPEEGAQQLVIRGDHDVDNNDDSGIVAEQRVDMPQEILDDRHPHQLSLEDSRRYFCDVCMKFGRGQVYRCEMCKFDVHPDCAVPVNVVEVDGSWSCPRCTLINNADAVKCEVCEEDRPPPPPPVPPVPLQEMLRSIRQLRYGRAEAEGAVLVPFGPPVDGVDNQVIVYDENGIPRAPPLRAVMEKRRRRDLRRRGRFGDV